MDGLLDDLNRALIAELARDPQLTRAELARRVDLSPPAVGDRIARLEEAGVIRHRLDVDATALGLPLAAWVRVRPAARQLPRSRSSQTSSPRSSSATASAARTASC